jgi:hypothetical protein
MGRWRVSRGDLFVINEVRQGSLAPAPAAIRLAYDRQRLNPHAAGLPGVWVQQLSVGPGATGSAGP